MSAVIDHLNSKNHGDNEALAKVVLKSFEGLRRVVGSDIIFTIDIERSEECY